MIVVTGGAGFIGSNLIEGLNSEGISDIIVVDDMTNGHKFQNLVGLKFLDYYDKDDFIKLVGNARNGKLSYELSSIKTIFHQGACSDTTEWDGKYMMKNNFEYSKQLLDFAVKYEINFIYASSAAVYGNSKIFKEELANERPLNMYGFSKWQFDQYVRAQLKQLGQKLKSQIVGLRYFNVYGPREQHKAGMASVAFHLNNQILNGENPKLFAGTDGFADGQQQRDFVYVGDIVHQNLWHYKNTSVSGVFNSGVGEAQTFNQVARAVQEYHRQRRVSTEIEYISFPQKLVGKYQSFTRADMTNVRNKGYVPLQTDVATGVKHYLEKLNA